MTRVNGVEHTIEPVEKSLLSWLRDDLGLTGTKYGCGEQACGACSVLVDGALARACVVPVADVVGRSVTTVEGLATNGRLHPVQQAFVDRRAMQCGYCTPGMVVAAVALLDAHSHPTRDQVTEWMAPNVCRCAVHPRIVDAIRAARDTRPQSIVDDAPTVLRAPRAPWDLLLVEQRDYFGVLGDGIVVVSPPRDGVPTGGAWLHIAPDGTVTAFTGKVEVGQGTRRELRIIVASELGAPIEQVRLVMGDTDVCPFDIGTFGSLSTTTAAQDLRRAAAGAPRGPVAPGTRDVVVVDKDPPARASHAINVSGGDVGAVTGAKVFASDIRLPGMLFGVVLRPPRRGAHLQSAHASMRSTPGVVAVIDDDFAGVAAATYDEARDALAAITATWTGGDNVDESDLESHLRAHPRVDGIYEHATGNVDEAFDAAAVRVTQTYATPYVAHAPMETRAAVAHWHGDRLTVWTGTQRPFGTRQALANAFGIDETRVRVIVPDTGTGFGGKHDPETAISAARLAQAAHAPVKVHWTREEEFTHAYFRPAAVIDVRVGATSDGDITAWDFVNVNSGAAGIQTPYAVANQRVRFQPAASPLRQGAYRALASTANHFARECAIDELAHELRVDPLEFRLRNLGDDRMAAVLRAAAEQFGWADRPRGAGIATGTEKGGRVATCVLVRVDGNDDNDVDNHVTLLNVVTAFECGAIIDADNLRSQVTGATIMGLSGALYEAVHFDAERILNPRFSEYRVARFADIPPIDVVLVDRPDLPSAGAGEAPIIAIAPALANAIFDATGRRVRTLPLLPFRD